MIYVVLVNVGLSVFSGHCINANIVCFSANASTRDMDNETCDTCTETESLMSSRRGK